MAKTNIKPIWIDEEEWECKKRGMYENGSDNEKIVASKNILTNFETLKSNMKKVPVYFPNETKVCFTSKMFNPISWLGQACCNLLADSKSQETISAWMFMEEWQQKEANRIAKEVIDEWRSENENIH